MQGCRRSVRGIAAHRKITGRWQYIASYCLMFATYNPICVPKMLNNWYCVDCDFSALRKCKETLQRSVKEIDRGIWQGRQIADSMMCYSKGFLLRFLSLVPSQYSSGKKPRKNQRRTKDEPKNYKTQKSTFIKITILFPSLIPCLISPTDDRETTERRATERLNPQSAFS